jgi:zinc protease
VSAAGLPAAAARILPHLPAEPRVERLDNGLVVCLLSNRRAPVVTTALIYRAGTRDEEPGRGGTAHFLEHMMFKGSARYGPGEIDRVTLALGGANNAYTSHDDTIYFFDFAPDRWAAALAIEADRMAGLVLDADEVASERQVILEEIAMYEGEPWDALELAVEAAFFDGHPYSRPVLGTRDELAAVGAAELAAFHRRFYRPDNAVLVVAGDVGDEALERVAESLGRLPAGAAPRPAWPAAAGGGGLRRLERRHGEVSRLLLALPAPPGDHPDLPALRLLTGVLAGGRASRLHHALVDDGQLCSWVSADVGESVDPGFVTVAAELVPGVEPARVEEEVLAQLAALVTAAPAPAEVERAKRIALADWIFGHERVHQQAMTVGTALALFDLGLPARQLAGMLATPAEELPAVAARYLRPEAGGVVGWSLPDPEGEEE